MMKLGPSACAAAGNVRYIVTFCCGTATIDYLLRRCVPPSWIDFKDFCKEEKSDHLRPAQNMINRALALTISALVLGGCMQTAHEYPQLAKIEARDKKLLDKAP